MTARRKQLRKLAVGVGFLTPNLLGFLAFTMIPLFFSLFLAFSNWDLRLHNLFVQNPIRFVGLEQFRILLSHRDFWRFFGNTLFLMMGIPLSIAGSLVSAVLLSQNFQVAGGRRLGYCVGGGLLIASALLLTLAGAGATAMLILISGLVCMVLIGGFTIGSTLYRTLFYLPNFTAGVATFLLWKKLYSPQNGPINAFLAPCLNTLTHLVRHVPPASGSILLWLSRLLMVLLLGAGLAILRKQWCEGEWGHVSALVSLPLLFLPAGMIVIWGQPALVDRLFPLVALLLLAVGIASVFHHGRMACKADEGLGNALVLAILLMTAQFILLGLGNVALHLPAMARQGLTPPNWLTDYYWAKPAIIILGVWTAIGSNNMLLYLAGLSNVPMELQEAADIDGASRFQRFWHITWPQLAPITFFIVVMSTIGGLQGGFEMAKSMTNGGPAGSTTTLSYFVYNEAFTNGRMGYASAIAWVLFLMVFLLTLFNWKFGSRYVND